jgi:anti-sigma factor RsiW
MAEPRCRAIRALLSAWIDGELPTAEASEVADHVATCAGGRAEHAGLATMRSLLRSLPERVAPADLANRAATRERAQRRRFAAAGMTAAVVAGLLGGAAFSLGGPSGPDARLVRVPVETFVADHLTHSVNGSAAVPTLGDGTP